MRDLDYLMSWWQQGLRALDACLPDVSGPLLLIPESVSGLFSDELSEAEIAGTLPALSADRLSAPAGAVH